MSSIHGDNYREWLDHQMKLMKVDILAKTGGLITRQTLRDEKWAEYTLRQIVSLVQEEERAREVIILGESPYTTFFTRWSLQLERLVIEGTMGTVIHVEESEGKARCAILVDATSQFEQIVGPYSFSRELYKKKEAVRIGRERCECGVVEGAEQVDRFTISEEYEVEWPEIWRDEVVKRKEVTLLLLWRVVLLECDVRLTLEANEVDCRDMLPRIGSASFLDWVPSAPITTPIDAQMERSAKVYQTPPAPNDGYSHFGHEYKVVPPKRSPGREPVPNTLPNNHVDGSSISVYSEEINGYDEGSDSDISEGSLLRLREEVGARWDTV